MVQIMIMRVKEADKEELKLVLILLFCIWLLSFFLLGLARALSFPRRLDEVTLEGKTVHYRCNTVQCSAMVCNAVLSGSTRDIQITNPNPPILLCPVPSSPLPLVPLSPACSPYDPHGRVFDGPSVTDNGFWDTFRTGAQRCT